MKRILKRITGALLAVVMVASLLPALVLSAAALGTGYAEPKFTIGVQGGAAPACHDTTLVIDADSCPEFDWVTFSTGYRAYESATGKTQERYWQQLQAYLAPIRDFLTSVDPDFADAFNEMLTMLYAETKNLAPRQYETYVPSCNLTYTYSWQRCQATAADLANDVRSYSALSFASGTTLDAALVPADAIPDLTLTSCFRAAVTLNLTSLERSGSTMIQTHDSREAYSNEITVAPHAAVTAAASTCAEPARQAYYVCPDCGGKVAFFTAGVQNGETVNGVNAVRCALLTDAQLVTSPALGHDYHAVVTPATCEAGGFTTHTCSRCGDFYNDTPTAALGHSYDPAVWIYDPSTARRYHVCVNCGEEFDVEVPRALDITVSKTDNALHGIVVTQDHDYPEFDTPEYASLVIAWRDETDPDLKAEKKAQMDGYRLFFARWFTLNGWQNTFAQLANTIEADPEVAVSQGFGVTYRYDAMVSMNGVDSYRLSRLDASQAQPNYDFTGGAVIDFSIVPRNADPDEYAMAQFVVGGLEVDWYFTNYNSYAFCGYYRVDLTPPVKTAAVAPDCETPGRDEYYTCSLCGDAFSFYRTNHVLNTVVCPDGVTRQKLDEIDLAAFEIQSLGLTHDYVLDTANSVARTCDHDGVNIYVCSVCGDTYSDYLPALGGEHSFAALHYFDPETGTISERCTRCGYRRNESAPSLVPQVQIADGVEGHHTFMGTTLIQPMDGFPKFTVAEYRALYQAWENETDPVEKAAAWEQVEAARTFWRAWIGLNAPYLAETFDGILEAAETLPDGFNVTQCYVGYSYDYSRTPSDLAGLTLAGDFGSNTSCTVPEWSFRFYDSHLYYDRDTTFTGGLQISMYLNYNSYKSSYVNPVSFTLEAMTKTAANIYHCETDGNREYYYSEAEGKYYSRYLADGSRYTETLTGLGSREAFREVTDLAEMVIPATDHNYQLVASSHADPTCTEDGKDVYRCNNTGCYRSYTVVLPNLGGHVPDGHGWHYAYDEDTQTAARWHFCTTCGERYDEETPVRPEITVSMTNTGENYTYHNTRLHQPQDYQKFDTAEYVDLYNAYLSAPDGAEKDAALAEVEGCRRFFRIWMNSNSTAIQAFNNLINAIEAAPSTAVANGLGVTYFYDCRMSGLTSGTFVSTLDGSADHGFTNVEDFNFSVVPRESDYPENGGVFYAQLIASVKYNPRYNPSQNYIVYRYISMAGHAAYPGSAPSCDAAGWQPYYKCWGCNGYFSKYKNGGELNTVVCADGVERAQLYYLGVSEITAKNTLSIPPLDHVPSDSWTFNADGTRCWHACVNCGDPVDLFPAVGFSPLTPDLIRISGRTLVFDSTFSARYLLRKDVFDAYLDLGLTVVSFTAAVNGEARDLSAVIGSGNVFTDGGVDYYWAKVDGIAAKDAAAQISFELICSYDGAMIRDAYSDSVKDALAQAATQGGAFASAANAALAYCKAAAERFGTNASVFTFTPVADATGFTPLAAHSEGNGPIELCATSLLLKDELAIKFWARPGDYAGSLEDLTVKINGETADVVKAVNGDYLTFKISVPVSAAKTAMAVELFSGENSVSNRYTDSVSDYALALSGDDSSLGQAILNYIWYADSYLESLAG